MSNDHNLASDWPFWCERGGEKSHLLTQKFFSLISAFCEVPVFELICDRWIISLVGFSSFEITPGFQILTLLHLSLVARQPGAPTLSSQPYYRPVWWVVEGFCLLTCLSVCISE